MFKSSFKITNLISCLSTASLISYFKVSNLIIDKYFINQKPDEIDNDDIYIESIDGSKQYASFIDNKSNETVVIIHDFARNIESYKNILDFYTDNGKNILIIKHFIDIYKFSFGTKESINISLIINDFLNKNPNHSLYLYGDGIGGDILLMMSTYVNIKNIKCIICDNAHISLENYLDEIIKYELKNNYSLIFKKFFLKYFETRFKLSINDLNYSKFNKSNICILFTTSRDKSINAKYLYNKNLSTKKFYVHEEIKMNENDLKTIEKNFVQKYCN